MCTKWVTVAPPDGKILNETVAFERQSSSDVQAHMMVA
jgi:hypothetical protein